MECNTHMIINHESTEYVLFHIFTNTTNNFTTTHPFLLNGIVSAIQNIWLASHLHLRGNKKTCITRLANIIYGDNYLYFIAY